MVSFQRLFVPLLLILVGTACQFPLAPKGSSAKGLQITFSVTQPHQRAVEGARLLLPTAKTLQVILTRDTTTVDTQTLAMTDGTATYSYTAELEVRVPHTITAKAFDASGALVFQGASNVVLFGDRAMTLYLLPVKAGSAWTSVAASAQPLSGTFGPQATPANGTSLTYLIDFGTTGTSFTFAPLAADLDLWIQRLDGSLVDPVPPTLTPADLGGQTAFWATYYQKGSNPVGTVGSFVIPLQGLSLPATYDIGLGATADLSTLLVKTPANATDGTVEWTVADPAVATIGLSTGLLTAGSPAVTPATTTVTVTQTGAATPFTATLGLKVHGPEFSRLTGLAASVDGVVQPLSFVQATLNYALPATTSPALTQSMALTANEGEVGQTLEWSTDGTSWTPMTTAVASTIPIIQGANDVRVRVTAPNGIDTNTYHVTVAKTVLPSGLSLSPSTFSEGIDATPAALFTAAFTLAQADDKGVTWTVDRTDLATIHPTTGVVTPLLEGTVIVKATSNAVPTLSATATLTLTPSQAQLKDARLVALTAQIDGVNQTLAFSSGTLSYALSPTQSTALTQLLTLTATGSFPGQALDWSSDGTTWTPMTTTVPATIPLVRGPNDVRVRVTALNGIDVGTYHVTVSKTVAPTSLSLVPATFSQATSAPPSVLFTPLFTLVETDDQTVTWSVDRPDLASIAPTTGILTPLLPGTVMVTATSNANPSLSATATLTLTPSQYLLKANDGAFWTELTTSPVKAPFGTTAIAGNNNSLWALGPGGSLKTFNGGIWQASSLVVPALTQWIAVDGQGMVLCATPTKVYSFNAGFWVSLPGPPVGIQGILMLNDGLMVWGTDGNLWSYQGALWTKLAVTLPAGTTAVVGGSSLIALTSTQIREFQAGFWSLLPVPALPQTASSTFALGQFVSLIVR